jgi:hypothetical protein
MRMCGAMTGALALLVLAACDKPGGNNAGQESADQTAATPATPVPAAAPVITIPPPDIPADGKIHVLEQKGKFRIKPGTVLCRIKPEIDPSLKDVAPGFYGPGKDGYVNGDLNEPLQDGTICADNAINVLTHWQLIKNTTGTPYALVLSARQGPVSAPSAVVRLAVARTERNLLSASVIANDMDFSEKPSEADKICARLVTSLLHDSERVSDSVITYIFTQEEIVK